MMSFRFYDQIVYQEFCVSDKVKKIYTWVAGSHLSPGGTHPVSSSPPGHCATPSHRREGGRHLPRAPGQGKSFGPEQGLAAAGGILGGRVCAKIKTTVSVYRRICQTPRITNKSHKMKFCRFLPSYFQKKICKEPPCTVSRNKAKASYIQGNKRATILILGCKTCAGDLILFYLLLNR